MTRPDPLSDAFDHAAGRRPGAGAHPDGERFARRVLDARRRGLDADPLPASLLPRLHALFAHRPVGAVGLLRLVLDSWRDRPVAVRGGDAPRFLAYAGDDVSLDLELQPMASGTTRMTIAVDGTCSGVRIESGEASRPILLDDAGVGHTELTDATGPLQVVLEQGDAPPLRTPPIDLERP